MTSWVSQSNDYLLACRNVPAVDIAAQTDLPAMARPASPWESDRKATASLSCNNAACCKHSLAKVAVGSGASADVCWEREGGTREGREGDWEGRARHEGCGIILCGAPTDS